MESLFKRVALSTSLAHLPQSNPCSQPGSSQYAITLLFPSFIIGRSHHPYSASLLSSLKLYHLPCVPAGCNLVRPSKHPLPHAILAQNISAIYTFNHRSLFPSLETLADLPEDKKSIKVLESYPGFAFISSFIPPTLSTIVDFYINLIPQAYCLH